MAISSVPGASSAAAGSSSSSQSNSLANSLGNVDVSQFLQMMITELQNQDPLNPMDNSQIMQELGAMQQISSTNQLTTTLNGMSLGQSLSSATSLIGKKIDGLDDSGNQASGVVQKVSIVNNTPKLYVGTQIVSLNNIQDVLPSG
ncbi:MAG TPA: flagellar hook capping FlgD N-terminal domain-containing protein [Pirellulales bacterium]|jgi:flagellar basal-body rod modification protein FlgD|nr:flagellar hook capping FlgD N-terminal domain-containing protein [Pirellulales bacterium]